MPTDPTAETRRTAINKRVLNEFGTKIRNEEKADLVVQSRQFGDQSLHAPMPFQCECDDPSCREVILMSTEEYRQVHRKTRNFVVVRGHVRLDLEEIVASFSDYVIVGKFFPAP